MKKIGSVTAILVLVLAASCATSPTVWDASYPQEESVEIVFYQMLVKSYNGIGVKGWTDVMIPAGEVNIGADVYISHAGVLFRALDMEFGCYLEAGKKYTISGAARNGQWGVNVYEGATLFQVANTPNNEKLTEFIPFKDQPDMFN
ncbi:MAG: hypothetical protein LBL56_06180 [Treponema sp.]|jgi:hypothetical protein|nr:hypothetical protein [Treponema sp.]